MQIRAKIIIIVSLPSNGRELGIVYCVVGAISIRLSLIVLYFYLQPGLYNFRGLVIQQDATTPEHHDYGLIDTNRHQQQNLVKFIQSSLISTDKILIQLCMLQVLCYRAGSMNASIITLHQHINHSTPIQDVPHNPVCHSHIDCLV